MKEFVIANKGCNQAGVKEIFLECKPGSKERAAIRKC